MAQKHELGKVPTALVGRGIPTDLAKDLAKQGWTLSKLKQSSRDKLLSLSIPGDAADAILAEDRPPIPNETLIAVLCEHKWVCCVCRDRNRGVVVHHVEKWSVSRSHDKENLVVLCANHHDEAHTSRELTTTLSPSRLRATRDHWLARVRELDHAAITGRRFEIQESFWDYFNHVRLQEVATASAIRFSQLDGHQKLLAAGWLDDQGRLVSIPNHCRNAQWLYAGDFEISLPLRFYFGAMVSSALQRISWVNPDDFANSYDIANAAPPGRLIKLIGKGP